VLRGRGFWIPRQSRIKILALAETLRRRLDVIDASKQNARMEVELQLAASSANAMHIDGQEAIFFKKKDAARAWAKHVEEHNKIADLEENSAQIASESITSTSAGERPRRQHPPQLQRKIDEIKRYQYKT